MEPVGFFPLVIGLLFFILAFTDLEWVMKNKGSPLVKILGRKGVKGWFAIAGLFFIIGSIFIFTS